MSTKVFHILGNGDKCIFWKREKREGIKLLCNMPPFAVSPSEVYATCMVDFKMMMALTQGSLNLDMYPWVLGTRPQMWMNDPQRSSFYLKYAPNIKEFYTHVPRYAENATNFNCGHMAVHYAANRHGADEINMYGFDTLLDFNMNSVTDLYLSSDRGNGNNYRLLNIWRPIWYNIFKEFPNTKFVLHHDHDNLKIPKLDNVEVKTYELKKKTKQYDEWSPQKQKEKEKEALRLATMNRAQRRAYEASLRKKK